jgi:hypothetical protein
LVSVTGPLAVVRSAQTSQDAAQLADARRQQVTVALNGLGQQIEERKGLVVVWVKVRGDAR